MPRRKDPEVQQRRARALEMRRAGYTWQQIADQEGYKTRRDAAKDVWRALDKMIEEPAADVLAAEVDRLDAMMQGVWPAARRGNLGAIDRVLRIQERRARYLGLDKGDPDVARAAGAITDLVAQLRDTA